MRTLDSIRTLAVVALCIIVLSSPVRADDSKGHALFLNVEGRDVFVVLDSPPSIALHPATGQQIPRYDSHQALEIFDALQREYLDEHFFEVIFGTRYGARRTAVREPRERDEPYVFFVDIFGESIPIELTGNPRRYLLDTDSGSRLLDFTPDEASAVHDALVAKGFGLEETVRVLLEARYGGSAKYEARVRQHPNKEGVEVQPLEPGCGECQDGNMCTWEGRQRCCTAGGLSCTVCTTCP